MEPRSLAGWTPIRIGWDGGRPVVDWCHTRGIRFDDPFFDQTIERCFRHPFRLLFRRETDMEALGAFVAEHPGLRPSGFVFHMSRCGSTLVAQMLGAVPAHLVLSEAGPVDTVLRASGAERSTWLQWVIGALGQPRDDRHQRLFVKFDAWSAVDLGLVRRTFPDVPWIFLYRDPVEVLVSQARRMGAHVIPGALPPELVGMSESEAAQSTLVDYAARVLAGICQAALEWKDDPAGTVVNCRQVPQLAVAGLADAWSLPLDDAEAARMLDVARRDAKNPVIPFEDDRKRKHELASPAVLAAAERWLAPVYRQLERARLGEAARAG